MSVKRNETFNYNIKLRTHAFNSFVKLMLSAFWMILSANSSRTLKLGWKIIVGRVTMSPNISQCAIIVNFMTC